MDLYAYDKNSIKNLLSTNLKSGRLPKNSEEITISVMNKEGSDEINLGNNAYKIGDKISLNNKEYTIVGTLYESKYDLGSISNITYGAITYLDENSISDENLLEIYVSNKNIKNVYKTSEKISQNLKINTDNISYNEELLNYSLVSKSNFKNNFYLIGITLLAVILVLSIVLIYTTLNILLNSRKKEIGKLLSIGCTKGEIRKLVLFEILVLTIIIIPMAFIISIGIVIFILNCVGNLLDNLILQDYGIFIGGANIPLNINIELKTIIISIIFILITIFISAIIPAISISNLSPIDAIRGKNKIELKKSLNRKKYILSKFITNEANIGYKYIKRSKANAASIIISLVICIIVFIVGSNYITNVYEHVENTSKNYNYLIYLENNSKYEKVINDLESKNLLKTYYTEEKIKALDLKIEKENMNEELTNFLNSEKALEGVFKNPYIENELLFKTTIFTIKEEKDYQNLLEKIGIKELKNGECILLNKINLPNFTSFNLTNYKKGDEISLNITDLIDKSEAEKEFKEIGIEVKNNKNLEYNYKAKKDINLKIKEITQEMYGYFDYLDFTDLYNSPIAIFVNKDTLNNIEKEIETQGKNFYNEENYETNIEIDLYINATNTSKIDEYLENNKIMGINYEKQTKSNNNKIMIMQIFLYSFMFLIGICTFLNIFNIIFSNMMLRKKEFKTLKSIGMTKKQISKMLRFESFYYSIISLIIGIIIGIIIFIIIYNIEYKINNNFLYNINISLKSILICILFTLTSIFTASYFSKKVLK